MSKASIIPLDYFLDMCPFDLYSKTGPSVPSYNPAIVPDVSMIHGMNVSTLNINSTTCLESQTNHPMLNGELLLSYCPSTSINIPCSSETVRPVPSLVPCALTQSCSTNNLQTIIQLCKTINEYLDDITRLLIQMDTSSDRRMHNINNLLKSIQFIVEKFLYIQQKLIKPLNESSSDMLKLNMLIRSNNNNNQLNQNKTSFYLNHRLHEDFIFVLKKFVQLINSSRISLSSTTNLNLQHKLDTIHEQTNLMHEHLMTITRKLETNII